VLTLCDKAGTSWHALIDGTQHHISNSIQLVVRGDAECRTLCEVLEFAAFRFCQHIRWSTPHVCEAMSGDCPARLDG
jgi:hypothetical protein